MNPLYFAMTPSERKKAKRMFYVRSLVKLAFRIVLSYMAAFLIALERTDILPLAALLFSAMVYSDIERMKNDQNR